MTTFVVSFVAIENLLPRLYRREFYADYERLMIELELQLTQQLRQELEAGIEHQIVDGWEISVEDLNNWYEVYCLDTNVEEMVIDETALSEEERLLITDRCLAFWEDVEIFHEHTSFDMHWFHLRAMRDHSLVHDSTLFWDAYAILYHFAIANNVRIIVWDIEAHTEQLGDILIDIDGRQMGDESMTLLGNEEIAVRQQNHYNQYTGGFAIALSGTFEPAYRVLNIISMLFIQILIAIFFISIAISAIFSRYLARPIVQLSEESKKLRELEFNESLKINRRDEIGNLSSNLNYMSYKLKNTLDDLQDANERLKKEMEREREQERQRRHLFTSISHELKTPITILKGEVGGMIDQVGDYKDRDAYLKSTYNWIETLEKLVSEILTISRLEGEKMRLDLTQIDISALLTKIYHTHQPLADNQEISFNKQIEAEIMIKADESQLQIAIANVINNAIFYTQPSKSVDIELKQEDKYVVLIVTNEGAHIAEEELKNIFDPFYRIDKSRNRYTGGSGLGLFIVKNILELHGFEYEITNFADGVRFMIRAPRA